MSVGKMNPLRDIVNSEKAIIGGGLPDLTDQNFTKLIWGKGKFTKLDFSAGVTYTILQFLYRMGPKS
jgi:hypothetical protein